MVFLSSLIITKYQFFVSKKKLNINFSDLVVLFNLKNRFLHITKDRKSNELPFSLSHVYYTR
jgi:hypothetical protein